MCRRSSLVCFAIADVNGKSYDDSTRLIRQRIGLVPSISWRFRKAQVLNSHDKSLRTM